MEIRFKIWDKKNKKMSKPVTPLDIALNKELVLESRSVCPQIDPCYEPRDVVFLLYANLVDKKGEDIYAEDILKDKDGLVTIKWSDGAFIERDCARLTQADANNFEKVGNSYEQTIN